MRVVAYSFIHPVNEPSDRNLNGGHNDSVPAMPPRHRGEAFEKIEACVLRPQRDLLVVEDEAIKREVIAGMLPGDDLAITSTKTGGGALAALRGRHLDCMVLHLVPPDVSSFEMLEAMQADSATRDLPVAVHTARDLSAEEANRLAHMASAIVVKNGRS